MYTKFKVSLILTSKQERELELVRFLDGLSSQTTPYPINLYFVNQSQEVLNYNWNQVGFNSEIITSGGLGLSAARNLALSRLMPLDDSCEIIGFPDDDCWYDEKVLENVISYFKLNPNVNCICTNVFDPSKQKSYGGRPLHIEKEITFRNIFKLPISVGIFIRRESFIANQIYFNEKLGAGAELGSGEETELIARLLESNCKINYVGSIQVYHPVSEYVEKDVLKFFNYAYGFGHLIASLVKKKHLAVIPFFIETFIRSSSGMLLYVFNPLKYSLYKGRVKGMFFGFLKGLKS